MKLYPVKSNNLVTTSINTQFHVSKEYVDYTLGFTISMDLYYDPATWNTSRYNSVCGRGNNTGFHSGMFVPGLVSGNTFMGSWRNASSYSTISTSGLTADWYRFSMVVTTTTAQIKLLNLRTNVELRGNVISVGTVTNGDNLAFTFLSYGIDGYTGAYGSIGVNFSNITISRNGTCLLHVPLSSGADVKVVDICNKTQYTLGFFTASTGWAKLSTYHHANFYYGYTLYTKSGSPKLYVCNGRDGSEISITPPTGYTKVANYGPCLNEFNQCESKFKLDDVNPLTDLYNADVDHVLFTKGTGVAKEFDISTFDVTTGYNRGYMYINPNINEHDFMMYSYDNTLTKDVKIIKYIGLKDEIVYEDDEVVYDDNDHVVLVL